MDVLARIALRYGTGALIAWGILDQDLAKMLNTDPDVLMYTQIAIGAVSAAIVE